MVEFESNPVLRQLSEKAPARPGVSVPMVRYTPTYRIQAPPAFVSVTAKDAVGNFIQSVKHCPFFIPAGHAMRLVYHHGHVTCVAICYPEELFIPIATSPVLRSTQRTRIFTVGHNTSSILTKVEMSIPERFKT